jgi:signal transduction histidine kinase
MATAIRLSAQRLHRLVQNFLLLAHLELHEADRERLLQEMRPGDLRIRVEEVARASASRAERMSDLRLELTEVLAPTREEYWSKIVEEIVDNAFKFSAAGSPVSVRLTSRGSMAVLRITDRGRGMKPEHIAEIGAYMQFERRFYEQQGSGMGLSIAKRLTELHGGRFTIASEAGVGTAVEVGLPLAQG